MSFLFPPPPAVAVPIAGETQSFPVRRVYCVGRNYAAHAREMGFDPNREPPFFFCKPGDAVVPVLDGEEAVIEYPAETKNYHYEIELVVAISTKAHRVAAADALDHVFGYAVGLDMTRRDLQITMREMGRPWEIGKSFDRSAPIGPLHRATSVGNVDEASIWLKVNGVDRQRSTTRSLIWSVPEIVADLSRYFELMPGDLIYTGTPEGVGPVVKGDLMLGGIDGLGEIMVRVAQ